MITIALEEEEEEEETATANEFEVINSRSEPRRPLSAERSFMRHLLAIPGPR